MKKSIFLVLTLAIPVAIFLFLKIFGDNEFEVPVLFGQGIPDCPAAGIPHEVPVIQFTEVEEVLNSRFLIYGALDGNDSMKLDELIIQLVRIQDAFYETGSPVFVLITEPKSRMDPLQTSMEKAGFLKENFYLAYLDHDRLKDFLRCGLGLTGHGNELLWNLVLVDDQRRIRGIYSGLDSEQTEQLILELKILRKKA
jgi:hypothetical protein